MIILQQTPLTAVMRVRHTACSAEPFMSSAVEEPLGDMTAARSTFVHADGTDAGNVRGVYQPRVSRIDSCR